LCSQDFDDPLGAKGDICRLCRIRSTATEDKGYVQVAKVENIGSSVHYESNGHTDYVIIDNGGICPTSTNGTKAGSHHVFVATDNYEY